MKAALIISIIVVSTFADMYEDEMPPPPPPPPPRPRFRPSFHKHFHEHIHLPPNYIVQSSPGYNSYGSYGSYPSYGYGGGYPSYGYGGFWPGIGGWSNPLGTGSSWAAGGGVVGNALSFLVG